MCEKSLINNCLDWSRKNWSSIPRPVFNIASYSLLTMMVAHVCDLELGDFVWTGGDIHVYLNHVDPLREQLQRLPRSLPRMMIADRGQDIFEFRFDDFTLVGYRPHPSIRMAIAV